VKKLVWLALLVVLLVGGKKGIDYFSRDREVSSYRNRVQSMLEGMQKGGNYQTAVCMWYMGTLSLDQRDFNAAADSFDAWREKRGLKQVTSFNVAEVLVEKERSVLGEGGMSKVTTVVDGRSLTFRVADRMPIDVAE
jgi:hypothetical protein